MEDDYSPKAFWTSRFLAHGHTGEVDGMLYAYDQPRRLRAIERAIARAGVAITNQTRILDFGCGTGDLIAALRQRARPRITGVDISDDTVRFTRARFAGDEGVEILAGRAEDMDFAPASFDLAAGINVLQHIRSDEALETTLRRLRRVVAAPGHAAVMDFSPVRVRERHPAPYIVVRSRQEYLDAFARAGWRLATEYALPRVGVRLYRRVNAVLAGLRGRPAAGARDPGPAGPGSPAPGGAARRAARLARAAVLAAAAPLDALLTPCPPSMAEMRILVFSNGAGPAWASESDS